MSKHDDKLKLPKSIPGLTVPKTLGTVDILNSFTYRGSQIIANGASNPKIQRLNVKMGSFCWITAVGLVPQPNYILTSGPCFQEVIDKHLTTCTVPLKNVTVVLSVYKFLETNVLTTFTLPPDHQVSLK